MATNLFETIVNPISGESFKCIGIRKEAYTMEWTLQPQGYVPFEHIHYRQDEVFQVKQGVLNLSIDGKEHVVKAGEQVTVPMGARHIACNGSDQVMQAIVRYSPALDYGLFMMCLCGLTKDGYYNTKGEINVPMMGYFLKKMKCQAMARPTKIPAPAFNMALNAFYLLGGVKGWEKLFKKYTI